MLCNHYRVYQSPSCFQLPRNLTQNKSLSLFRQIHVTKHMSCIYKVQDKFTHISFFFALDIIWLHTHTALHIVNLFHLSCTPSPPLPNFQPNAKGGCSCRLLSPGGTIIPEQKDSGPHGTSTLPECNGDMPPTPQTKNTNKTNNQDLETRIHFDKGVQLQCSNEEQG